MVGNRTLGAISETVALSETFASATIPALPIGWTSEVSGTLASWVTTDTVFAYTPNSVIVAESAEAGISSLYSPIFNVGDLTKVEFSMGLQLASVCDGLVIEINIGDGEWQDLLLYPVSFVAIAATIMMQ